MAARKRTASKSTPSQSAKANAVLLKIRALRDEVPGFILPLNARATKQLILLASVSDEFLESCSVSVQSSEPFEVTSGVDADSVRDTIRFSAAYAAVADEAEAFVRGVRHTIAVRRAETVQACLAAYELAKAMSRKPEGRDLVPHIADMRRTLNRGSKKKAKKAKEEPEK